MTLFDFHTHHLRPGSIVNVDPSSAHDSEIVLKAPYLYSVGIHPWNAGAVRPEDIDALRRLAHAPRVIAIGETGLDSLHPGDRQAFILKQQEELLRLHIGLSEETAKPLILHIVRRFPEIIRMKLSLKPTQPWIIHGFRGKPELARELTRHGFYLSFGEHFNPAALAATPLDRVLLETDDSALSVREIAAIAGVTDLRSQMERIAPQAGKLGTLDGGVPED